jgi:RND family efflux transporter MFP subunit
VDAGNLVQQGQTLMTTLLALDPVYAVFDASEAQHLRLRARPEAAARPAAAGRRRRAAPAARRGGVLPRGRLDFVDSAFDPRSGTIRNRAVVPNPDLFLTPGSFARLRLSAGDASALMVPDAAVVADQSGRMVLTVAPDGTVAPRPVQLGPLVEGLRVVRAGLDPATASSSAACTAPGRARG